MIRFIRRLLIAELAEVVNEQRALVSMMSEYPKDTMAYAACNLRYALNDLKIAIMQALCGKAI